MAHLMSQSYKNQMDAEKLALEASRVALWQAQDSYAANKQAQQNASKLASEYLKQWNSWNSKMYGLTSTAIQNLNDTVSWLKGTGGTNESITQLDSLSKTALSDWEQFTADYAPLGQEYMQGSREAMASQKAVNERYLQMLETDPTRVSGDAMADVASASNLNRKAEARRLTGLGIDPTSAKYRQAMKSSYTDEALSKAIAANQARNLEDTRVQGLIQSGPSNAFADQATSYGGLFLSGADTGTAKLKNAVDASTAATNARTGIASSIADLTSAQTGLLSGLSNTASGYGELATGLLGASNYAVTPTTSGLNLSGYRG